MVAGDADRRRFSLERDVQHLVGRRMGEGRGDDFSFRLFDGGARLDIGNDGQTDRAHLRQVHVNRQRGDFVA